MFQKLHVHVTFNQNCYYIQLIVIILNSHLVKKKTNRINSYVDMFIQYLKSLSLHTITVLPLTIVYFVSEVHCTLNVQYLTLLSLHTITVLPLTTVYIVSEVCTLYFKCTTQYYMLVLCYHIQM